MDVYEIEGGRYQVDTESGSFVFGKSRFASDSVECFEAWPESTSKDEIAKILIKARANGLPL